MKARTTQKAVKNGYSRIISIGYCDAQNLLNRKNPSYYTAGTYGWNADVYDFGNTAIVTGYRPFGTTPKSGLVREYDDKARAILNSYDRVRGYDQTTADLDALIAEFLDAVGF